MRVARLEIKNFRGIKNACLDFDGHTLLLGMNNVGKSTVCEALELVLGPERLSKSPPVEEFDFYNARYLEDDGETPIPIEIDVTLTELSEESCQQVRSARTSLAFGSKEGAGAGRDRSRR